MPQQAQATGKLRPPPAPPHPCLIPSVTFPSLLTSAQLQPGGHREDQKLPSHSAN